MRPALVVVIALIVSAAGYCADTPQASAARRPKPTPRPGITTADSTKPRAASPSPPRARRRLRTPAPAPVSPPASPVPEGRTTIAPFPVPGDTSRGAAERMKALNVPKPGVTILVPTPPPGATPGVLMVTPDSQALPKFGDYVYVEELPEAIERVAPSYPDEARKAGVQGTVMVQALVLRDGSVGDTRIVRSIPGLDEAAAAAVRRWRFKPALAKGQPLAVWVGVPVKFSLH